MWVREKTLRFSRSLASPVLGRWLIRAKVSITFCGFLAYSRRWYLAFYFDVVRDSVRPSLLNSFELKLKSTMLLHRGGLSTNCLSRGMLADLPSLCLQRS